MPYLVQTPDIYPIDADPESVAIGDVTGDGIDDIVVTTTGTGADGDRVLVYVGNAAGLGGTPARYPLEVEPTRPGVVIVDLDENGLNDVVVGHWEGLTVFRSGGAALAPAVQHDDLDQFHLEDNGVVVTTDVDNDGHADVIGVPWNFDLMFYYGDGAGGFRDRDVFQTTAHGHTGAVMGDVNGDNEDDLVILTGLTETAFGVHEHLGPTFEQVPDFYSLPASDFAAGLAVADVTADGRADVIVADSLNRSLFVFPQVTGAPGTPVEVPIGAGIDFGIGSPGPMVAHDLDGDGDPDLAVTLAPGDSLGLYFSDPSGIAEEVLVPWPSSLGHSQQGIAVGDVDDDGCPDIAAVDRENGLVVGLGNCGTEDFDPCPGSDGDDDGVGDACDCAPTDPALPNEYGACPVGPPPEGGPPPRVCATGASAPSFLLLLAALSFARRRRA